jgi:hypothetical protein
MPDMSSMDAGIRQLTPKQLRAAVANFLPESGSEAERIGTIEAGLRSLAGQSLRDAMAEWIVRRDRSGQEIGSRSVRELARSGERSDDVRGGAPLAGTARS